MKTKIASSELPLNSDGSVYHLKLMPEHLANICFLVGDPARVDMVSRCFDSIECKVESRELKTHTGYYQGKRISVISTGMGTDNIDIVMNELDVLCNIDLKTMEVKAERRSLELIRLGTCGALHAEYPIESFCASSHALGLDGLLNYYTYEVNREEDQMLQAFLKEADYPENFAKPYFIKGSENLLEKIAFDMNKGITATAFGFFGPQGRMLRLGLTYPEQNNILHAFAFQGHKIANYDMETAGIYGLGRALGHHCLTICVVIANREHKTFCNDYHGAMQRLIETSLDRL